MQNAVNSAFFLIKNSVFHDIFLNYLCFFIIIKGEKEMEQI